MKLPINKSVEIFPPSDTVQMTHDGNTYTPHEDNLLHQLVYNALPDGISLAQGDSDKVAIAQALKEAVERALRSAHDSYLFHWEQTTEPIAIADLSVVVNNSRPGPPWIIKPDSVFAHIVMNDDKVIGRSSLDQLRFISCEIKLPS